MKPYMLVLHNKIRFAVKRFSTKKICVEGIQMFGRNTKLCFGKKSDVHFGERIVSDGRMVIIVDDNANLSIGSCVYFNEDAMISCKGRIDIGNGCKFGPNVKIFDNNHRFDSFNGVSNEHSVGEIIIGEQCWIGSNAVILKGAKIGRNSVIGAGCIVNGEIPEASIVTQGRELTVESMRV